MSKLWVSRECREDTRGFEELSKVWRKYGQALKGGERGI